MNRVHQRLELATDGVTHKLVLSDIHDALNNQIKGKAAGPDGIDMEAYLWWPPFKDPFVPAAI